MSDERLNELLRSLPGEDEIRTRAARARKRALARLDEPKPAARGWLWAPAAVALATVLVVAGFLARGRPAAPPTPVASQSPIAKREPEKLRMKWVLSDGTRVLWTFREDLNL